MFVMISVICLLILFSFLSIWLESFFSWWTMFSYGGFGHPVTFLQKEYSSPLLVEQSVLSFFDISFVVFLLEESFCIITFWLIPILLSSVFSFVNNLVLVFNLLVWELMLASTKTWSSYCLFHITLLRKMQISFMKKTIKGAL